MPRLPFHNRELVFSGKLQHREAETTLLPGIPVRGGWPGAVTEVYLEVSMKRALPCWIVLFSIVTSPIGARSFIRGDANQDAVMDISDALAIFGFLFSSTPVLSCDDAADANDDGSVDLSDGLAILEDLLAGVLIPPPRRVCGADPTPDALGCGSSTCPDEPSGSFEERLARRWAPIHYQDVDTDGCDSERGTSDYITAIDFDGEWNTLNNWENMPDHRLAAHCYYSVVSSATHWFLVYAFYHPRDWAELCFFGGTHENDLEGMLTIVRRPASPTDDELGSIEAMVTVFHNDFFSYDAPESSFSNGQEDIDGRLTFEEHEGRTHPVTAQEAKGHGLKAAGQVGVDASHVRYVPDDIAQQPAHSRGPTVSYRLVDILERGGMWERRFDSETFVDGKKFRGDNGSDNAANAPWAWDDNDDGGQLLGGELAVDPIKLLRIYFNVGNRPFSFSYESNAYLDVGPTPPGALRLQSSSLSFVPPHTRGDGEYDGHGPRIDLSTTIRIRADGRAIEGQVSMKAEEWSGGCASGSPRSDFTTAEGLLDWTAIAFAPDGKRILRIVSPGSSGDFCFVDSDHDLDSHVIGGLVQRYEVLGDTDGSEAGTKTRVTVFFNPIDVEAEDVPEDRTASLSAVPLSYTPPHTRGDAEFDGHGPRVDLETLLRIRADGLAIEAGVGMKAEEWQGSCGSGSARRDFTTAEGFSDWVTVASAPPDRLIRMILSPTVASNVCYVDSDHDLDRVDGDGPVDRYEVVGDTRGDEAGARTRVTVFFNVIEVELE